MEYSRHLLFSLMLLAIILHVQSAPNSRRSRATKLAEESPTRQTKITPEFKEDTSTTSTLATPSKRKNKALNFFGYFPSFLSSGLDYAEDDDDDVTFSVNDDNIDDEDLSRTIPTRRRNQNKKKPANVNGNYQNENLNSLQYDNSPIFYIRLPPTPYMFVPGLGYVSQPPNLGPPMGPMSPAVPQQVDPFISLPLDYVSNAKPTGVYQWSGAPGYPQVPQMPQMDPFGYGPQQPMMPPAPRPTYSSPSYSKPKPKPSNSKVTNLKGPYVFNGKPSDSVFVLRDTYNSIYSDALQNFYP